MESAASKGGAATLLTLGVLAGPLYVLLGLFQMAIRPGFDITRHPLSLLSNGELGWIQVANFFATGALIVCGAAGVKGALRSGVGHIWAPRMLALYGLGLVGAGIFSADPALGFPRGTPADNNPISTHGLMHFVVGTFGFTGFIASCFILARRFRSLGRSGWSAYSLVTGLVFLVAFLGIASGSKGPVSLYFALAVAFGFVWLSAVLNELKSSLRSGAL